MEEKVLQRHTYYQIRYTMLQYKIIIAKYIKSIRFYGQKVSITSKSKTKKINKKIIHTKNTIHLLLSETENYFSV